MTNTLGFVGVNLNKVPDPPADVRVKLRSVLAVPLWSKDPDMLTAAKVLGWSKTAAYKAAKEGRLPVIHVSETRYVVSTAMLLRLVDGDPA